MTLPRSLLLLLALWAAVYLTGLGAREIKGEEGRRILPAAAMLRTGDWLVPRLNGEPYLRKPPLVNWAIASSFALAGRQSEFTARLPSALAILATALALYRIAGPWIGRRPALAGAAVCLTLFGLMEKGRIAEIEAVYAALASVAILLWARLADRATNAAADDAVTATGGGSRWAAWLAAAPLLGLGLLAKGPLHFLFFGAAVSAVSFHLARARGSTRPMAALRAAASLCSPPAIVGWLVAASIFAAWALPYFREIPADAAAGEWRDQTAGRLLDQFDFAGWALNLPRALSDLLPWVLLAPILWKKGGAVGRSPVFRGIRDGASFCFVGLLLVPGVLPRYLLPLAPCYALLLAVALEDLPESLAAKWRRAANSFPPRISDAPGMILKAAAIVAAIIAALALALPPLLARREGTRPAAATLDAAMPPGGTVHAVDIGYQPLLFYLDTPVVFIRDEKALRGTDSAYLLGPEKVAKKLRRDFREIGVVATVSPPNAKPLALIRVEGPLPRE